MSDPNVNDALAHAYQSIEQMQAQLDSNHRLFAALYQILGAYEAPAKVLDAVTEALDGKVVDADKLLPVKEPQPKGLDWAIARCDALMSQGFDRILIAAMKADFVNAKEAGVGLPMVRTLARKVSNLKVCPPLNWQSYDEDKVPLDEPVLFEVDGHRELQVGTFNRNDNGFLIGFVGDAFHFDRTIFRFASLKHILEASE